MASTIAKKWTADEEVWFKAAWSDPANSAQQVADECGRTKKAVQLHARLAGYPAKLRKAPVRWTDDHPWGQRMRQLYIVDNRPSSEVAAILSHEMADRITRNMVVSVAKRLKWNKAEMVAQRKEPQKVTKKTPKVPKPKKLVVMANTTVIEAGDTAPRYVVKDSAWQAIPGSEPKDMWARTGCKWPVGHLGGADQLFCCEPTEMTYCEAHNAIAHQPTGSAKELQRGLRNLR